MSGYYYYWFVLCDSLTYPHAPAPHAFALLGSSYLSCPFSAFFAGSSPSSPS